jgi:hypothetical protein
MDVKKKLVELLKESKLCSKRFDDQYSDGTIAIIADYLIANGVTVQEWKPESEPPKLEGSYIVETVTGAVTTARYYTPMVFPATSWRGENRREGGWQSNRKVVRWMPLPEPPKGE